MYRYRPMGNQNLLDCFGDIFYGGEDSLACMVERDAFAVYPSLRETCSECDWSSKNSIMALVYTAASVSSPLFTCGNQLICNI